MKVMVVDDEPLVRKALIRVLRGRGHDVVECENGFQALDCWLKESPDLVFLDILMPGMTGIELLKKLGEQRKGKVVLISAYSGENKCDTEGADLFLQKPFSDIFEVVRAAEALVF